jgi:D-psicose/D-tagatose/L-ribulose 3-epimerase
VTGEHAGIIRAIKKAGYDGVEIPMFEGTPDHYARLGALLDKEGLGRTVVSVIGGVEKNPLSGDASARAVALDYAKWTIDCTAALGAEILGGPMHSTLGHFSGSAPTNEERKRAIAFHRKAGDHAAKKKVKFALEALNRFECYFLNTMEQLADYLDEVDHPHVKGMYDTFHANIEEKDPVAAIKAIKKHMIHVHISENDRGTPGKGHVPWAATYKALRAAKYDGWLTIEAFGRALPQLAAATRVWRDFFPSRESCYKDGIKSIKTGWAKAK